jgi:hypothetical protein
MGYFTRDIASVVKWSYVWQQWIAITSSSGNPNNFTLDEEKEIKVTYNLFWDVVISAD